MLITHSMENLPPFPAPISLSIGSFDGVHLGHCKLLSHFQDTRVILTFSNHPLEILAPTKCPPPIISLTERLDILKSHNIDLVILLPFTEEFAKQSYDHFIQMLHHALPFTSLILGKGATFGKNQEGTSETVTALGQTLGFETTYLEKKCLEGLPISSRRIRKLLQNGEIKKANELLGYTYALSGMLTENRFFPSIPPLLPPGNYQATFQSKPVQFNLSEEKSITLSSSHQTTKGKLFLTS